MSYVSSVQRAIDYMEEHLDEELDLSSIAEEAYMSVAQLYRVFYALTGHPVKDYVRKRRMSVAANHLRNTNRTVEELAWESGFESYHSFAKVFKKIVGMTPAAYRNADIFFSFEPIRLHEQVAYMEDREHTEQFPDVKVVRMLPGKVYSFLHVSPREAGMENEAFRLAYEKLQRLAPANDSKPKVRIFGSNVDVPRVNGEPRFGYRIMIADADEWIAGGDDRFAEEPFSGGLYAVRKITSAKPDIIQDGWNRLLAEWLPKSTFEIGTHSYVEEFIAYNGKITRMNLYLPVQRKHRIEPIEIVYRNETEAVFCRGYGAKAQADAERLLIDWYSRSADAERPAAHQQTYYMSFHYGNAEPDSYWWENGLLGNDRMMPEIGAFIGLERKRFGPGLYACCVSKIESKAYSFTYPIFVAPPNGTAW